MLKKNKTKIISIIFILIGISMCLYDKLNKYLFLKNEDDKVLTFMNDQYKKEVSFQNITNEINQNEDEKLQETDKFIGVLEIPKLKLKKGFYDENSIHNNVSENVMLLKSSDMPNTTYGLLALAAHSGNSIKSYFKSLYKLTYEDEAIIYYDKIKYNYKLKKIYEVEKNGYVNIKKELEDTSLALITCDKIKDDKQVVYLFNLYSKQEM